MSELVILPRAGEIVAPVPDVEYSKHKGKADPGEHVDLLGLELKVLEPHEKLVGVPDRQPDGVNVIICVKLSQSEWSTPEVRGVAALLCHSSRHAKCPRQGASNRTFPCMEATKCPP